MPTGTTLPVKVFVVEPFPTTSAVICRLLKGSGARVVGSTGSAATALARAKSLRPDVIVLDGAVSYKGGQTLIAQLKDMPRTPKIILLSSHGDEVYREAAAASGADLVIIKTRLIRELLPAMRSMSRERPFRVRLRKPGKRSDRQSRRP